MLGGVSRLVVQKLGSSAFYFTVAAARFHRDRRSLQFAGAGHPPAMLIRGGESPQLLESQSMVLGLFEDAVDSDSTMETPGQAAAPPPFFPPPPTQTFHSPPQHLLFPAPPCISR